jgi:uncharacterized membrane-anchored protein
MTSNQPLHPPIRNPWRFWLPFAAQAALIMAVPAQAMYTHLTGQTVVLQVMPVDPYDLFRGYYVVLSYDISNLGNLEALPGWKEIEVPISQPGEPVEPEPNPSLFDAGQEIYVTLQAPENPADQPPEPWKPIAVSSDRPTNLPSNQVALHGTLRSGRIVYGLETYYIPEDERLAINDQINHLQSASSTPDIVVETKVNAQGQAVPLSVWLSDRRYRF